MLRFGARLVSIGSKRCKINNYITTIPAGIPANRLIQSSGQITYDSVSRHTQDTSPRVLSLLNYIQDFGFDENEIKILIENKPELMSKSPALWQGVLGSLVNYGLKEKDILSILNKFPQVLSLKKTELDKTLEAWFSCGFGDELTNDILTTHPYFLQVNHLSVVKRVKQYQIYFEGKKKTGKLLLTAPNTLEESWDELLDKLNYLDELCTEKNEIVSSGVLAHSALHIKARHEFLIRAGVYKRPGKDYNKKLCKNPKLTTIVNSSDGKFAWQVAGLSLLEYEVFFEMFEKECKEIKNYDINDDERELSKLSYQKHLKKSRKLQEKKI